jgi:spermidine synthase
MIQRAYSPFYLCFATLLLAACSMLYEFTLAQTLATTMGNTILRYNMTVGIYCASLGAGALYFSRWQKSDSNTYLINVEILLALTGSISPILIVLFDYQLRAMNLSADIAYPITYLFNHSLIILIGILSGIELPLLMRLGGEINDKWSNRILAVDYAGTLIAVVAFPLLLLPATGIFATAMFVASLNLIVAATLAARTPSRYKISLCIIIIGFICTITAVIYDDSMTRYIVNEFYMD